MGWRLFETKELTFFSRRAHDKFFYEDALWNSKRYTLVNKHKNMYLNQLKQKIFLLFFNVLWNMIKDDIMK